MTQYENLVTAVLMNKIHHQLKTIYVYVILQYTFSVYIFNVTINFNVYSIFAQAWVLNLALLIYFVVSETPL